ncbi:MAG: methyltransferase domain-containing protein [Nocardioidaceae bacterium]|nr:methyltransferase domain-containing protein [Nocardioidaceae bacterium]
MSADQGAPSVAEVFDMLADVYDQTGVEFFQPVGAGLVAELDPRPGERCLDIGCGRGAATLPLARAVAPGGSVDAVDVAPAMVAATRSLVEQAGLAGVRVEVADAADLAGYDGGYDVVASSLVLFFLSGPGDVLRRWAGKLRPGGRIGLTTFGELDEATQAIDDLFVPWQPQAMLDARTSGTTGPFGSDAGMEELFAAAGIADVRTVVRPTTLEFADVAAWQRFMMSTGQRAMWRNVPEEERPGFLERAAAILEGTRVDGGPGRLVWQMRYTLGARPS